VSDHIAIHAWCTYTLNMDHTMTIRVRVGQLVYIDEGLEQYIENPVQIRFKMSLNH